MKTPILTVAHEFHVHGDYSVLSAEPGIPVHISIDAAADLLESAVSGLRNLMQSPESSTQATLICFAVESALALVYSAQSAVDAQSDEPEKAPLKVGGDQ